VQSSRVGIVLLAGLVVGLGIAMPVSAQSQPDTVALPFSLLPVPGTGINVSRNMLNTPFSGEAVNNLNLGMSFSPAKGLDLRADAWRIEVEEQLAAARLLREPPRPAASGSLFIDDSNLYAGLIDSPSVKDSVIPGQLAHGIDLSASYVWESPRFGQFIVSTKATYLYDQADTPLGFQGPALPMTDNTLLPKGTELQSSVMLTWQAGKHTASAVTHYFDSFEEIGKLDMEQLNEIVGNMTTLDLQYGYNVKAGKQGQAVFSVGVRNLFDTRPQQLPPVGAGQVEQGGRVAYGSIKYQF
jgi:outer membrane receptor protein involved in Fe transport